MRFDGTITTVLMLVGLMVLLIYESGHGRFPWASDNVVPDANDAGALADYALQWAAGADFSNRREFDYNAQPWGPPRYVHWSTAI